MKKILTILTTLASTITIENCISNFNLRTITLQNDCFKKMFIKAIMILFFLIYIKIIKAKYIQ
ncbi:hypothetical protein SHM_12970 [Spiroplasma ixodetis]|uniref:Spiroplasmavirus-related protein n=1 Tax=Spiroplasma ixodetis TaxID=2141 RepID=A0ABN6T1C1_9MOLU|nr:hypothetical protein SHM_12970 [Spiroplasma ixodetis]